jgi:hypothetical protein
MCVHGFSKLFKLKMTGDFDIVLFEYTVVRLFDIHSAVVLPNESIYINIL